MLKRLIGLTGGVGMGKTTVSHYLADRYQLPILDADQYARDAVLPGTAVLKAIAQRYGSFILAADGSLNRRQLGEIVFQDAAERQWLEQQIHPYVRDRFQAELQRLADAHTVVLVIPLLFEAQMTDLVTEVWVIYCSAAQQQARLAERDRLDSAQIQARIHSQMPIAAKIARADVVLDNSSTLAALQQQIDAAMARAHPALPEA